LRREQPRRLGAAAPGLAKLQAHPFFLGMDWEVVGARRMTPVYVPPVNGTEDVANFESVFTREAAVDSVVVDRAGPGAAGAGGAGGKEDDSGNGFFNFLPQWMVGGVKGETRRDDEMDYPEFEYEAPADQPSRGVAPAPAPAPM
jgi:hypothetical protein